MAKAQHRTPAYRRAKLEGQMLVQSGSAYCAQPECVMPNRWIQPDAPWDLAHNDAGTIIYGPAHRKCNRRDGAIRGNKMRRPKRWSL